MHKPLPEPIDRLLRRVRTRLIALTLLDEMARLAWAASALVVLGLLVREMAGSMFERSIGLAGWIIGLSMVVLGLIRVRALWRRLRTRPIDAAALVERSEPGRELHERLSAAVALLDPGAGIDAHGDAQPDRGPGRRGRRAGRDHRPGAGGRGSPRAVRLTVGLAALAASTALAAWLPGKSLTPRLLTSSNRERSAALALPPIEIEPLDAPPVVTLGPESDEAFLEPGQPRPVPISGVLTLDVTASDDQEVAAVDLEYVVQRPGAKSESTSESAAIDPAPGRIALPLPGVGTRLATGEARLEVAGLGDALPLPMELQPGDLLTYRVRAADNRPIPRGPNLAWSESRTIAIVAGPTAARRRSPAQHDQLDALRQSAESTRRDVAALGGQPRPDNDAASLDRSASAARTLAEQLENLVARPERQGPGSRRPGGLGSSLRRRVVGPGSVASRQRDRAPDSARRSPRPPGRRRPRTRYRDPPRRRRDPRQAQPGEAAGTSLPSSSVPNGIPSGRNWGNLPGHLRDALLQTPPGPGRYRDAYAPLIQRYFRAWRREKRMPSRGAIDEAVESTLRRCIRRSLWQSSFLETAS